MKNKEEKAYTRIVILGLLLFFDIFFFILLIKLGFSTLIGIYGGINVYIFPYLVYNFGKGLLTYGFKIREGTFKIIFFSILINVPFLFPLINYLMYGRINFGGFTGFENPSTLLKLFIILDGVLLPIIVLSYSSGKKEKIEEKTEESDKENYEEVDEEVYDEGEEKIEEPEQGNVYSNEYENMYGDEYGNTETNADQYSFSNSDTVKEIDSKSNDKILSGKSNLKKEEIKQLVYDKDISKNREDL